MANRTNQAVSAPAGGGMAIASFVLGIVALLTGWIPFLPLITALIGLVLGIMDRKSARRALAITGIVLCALEIVWQIFYGGALIKNHGHLEFGTPPEQVQTQ
jgi:hypothetical protein